MSHAHAFYDQPLWSTVTAAKLRTNLTEVPVPEPLIFIHQCAPERHSSPSVLHSALRPHQSTPKKGSTPSSLLPGKANPWLFLAPLAPSKFCNMMAEDLHWVGLSLGEPGAALKEGYHQIRCNCGSQVSRAPFLIAFLNTSPLAKLSQF